MPPLEALNEIASLAKVVQDEPDPDSFASHLALHSLSRFDCRSVVLGAIHKEGFLDLIGAYGLEAKSLSESKRVPLWIDSPMTRAARTGESIFLRSVDELIQKFPSMVDAKQLAECLTLASPVKHRGAVIGSVVFAFIKKPHDNPATNLQFEAVLSLCSVYLKNLVFKQTSLSGESAVKEVSLTPRQLQIIEFFKENLTTEQIAVRLKFSHSTIKQDIIRIFEIFGVNSRSEVVRLSQLAGIAEREKISN